MKKRYSKGQSASEYGLVMGLVVLVAALALAAAGTDVRNAYCSINKAVGGRGCAVSPTSWNAIRGGWSEEGAICNQTLGEGQILAEGFRGDNYSIHINKASLYQGDGYGVIFRYTLKEKGIDGYTFQFDPGYGNGAFLFRKWVNGAELAPFEVVRTAGYDWYSPHAIRLELRDNEFSLFIDNELITIAVDESYGEGGVGLRTWDNSHACFEGITVTTP
jgi:fructan beta-fructosidase